MLAADEGVRADLAQHVARVAALSGVAEVDVRTRLVRPGVTLLGALEPAAARRAAEALDGAGYQALVIRREDLPRKSRPQRAVGVRRGEGALTFLGNDGEELLRVSGQRLLMVLGDLDMDPLATLRTHQRMGSEGALAAALTRGHPALRIFCEGDLEASVLVLGRRFNFTTLGEQASVSAALNLQALLAAAREAAGEVTLDLDFRVADAPPVAPTVLLDEAHPSIEAFEAHALCARLLWLKGVGAAPARAASGAAPGDGGSDPALADSVDAASRVMADPERVRTRWRDRLSELGPWWLYAGAAAVWLLLVAVKPPDSELAVLSGLALPASAPALYYGFRKLLERREIEDYPTSRARSVAMGKAEVIGRARQAVPMRAPWSGLECVWFRWVQQELVQQGEQKQWRTVGRGSSGELPFLVEDDTGCVMVDPAGARVETSGRQLIQGTYMAFHGGSPISVPMAPGTRVVEETLPVGRPLYVLGTARPIRAAGERRSQLRQRLRALKADPERLRTFDTDGDGHIDEDEWAAAVEAVELELSEARLADAREEAHTAVIGRGGEGDLFLISDRSENELLRALTLRAWAGILGGLAAFGGGVWGLLTW